MSAHKNQLHKGCCREEGYNLLSISSVNVTGKLEFKSEGYKLGTKAYEEL